jgi:hypothetical protein
MRSFFSFSFSEGIFRPLFFIPCDTQDMRIVTRQMKDRKFRRNMVLAAGCHCSHGFPRVLLCNPLHKGRPFPTLFWLSCPFLRKKCATLETAGGVRELESALSPLETEWAQYHRVYAALRSLLIQPAARAYFLKRRAAALRALRSTGVGGTMQPEKSGEIGVKCLHLQVAAWLALGTHPAGDWLEEKIGGDACGEPERHGCQCVV